MTNSMMSEGHGATTEQSASSSVLVQTTGRIVAAFSSVADAFAYPPRELPSGSRIVNAGGRVLAVLERQYSPAGRALPCWVLEL